MEIKFIARKKEIRDEVRDWAERKLAKLDKYLPEAASKVTLWTERGIHYAEITVNSKGTIFRAEVSADEEIACIDRAVAVIERQIAKNKTRLAKRLREGAVAYLENEDFISDIQEEDISEDKDFNVIKVKVVETKPLSVEEAILQMNLLSHNFFIFKNDNNIPSVVYKRKDNDYGVIEMH